LPAKLLDELEKSQFRVAIFGSARIGKKDANYKLIFDLAKLIAAEGIDVVTGGGPGLMDAASRGHHFGRRDSKSHSIGLNIRLPFEQTDAEHLDIKKDFFHFSERLDHFMVLSNAVVVAPGGVGTLLELFYTWQLMQVKHICNVPIVLLGSMWHELVGWIRKWPLAHELLDEEDLELLFITKSCDDAFTVIREAYDAFSRGDENFCLNYHLYKLKEQPEPV
jgi:uncharacterized protein (TIGR00730 family)